MANEIKRSAESVIRGEQGLESTDKPQNKNEREPVKLYGRPNAKGNENLRNPMKLGIKSTMGCEASAPGGSGHSGDATHIFSFDSGHPESDIAVCSAHLPKLIRGSIKKGELNFNHRPIEANDVAPLKALRAVHTREVIEPYEHFLSSKGISKADSGIGIGADAQHPGKGGPHGKKVMATAKEDHVATAIEEAKAQGGHRPLKATGGHVDEKGRVYTFPKKTTELTGPRKPKAPKENPEVTEEEISRMPAAFAAISRQTKAERAAAGIPVTGNIARGFSKINNRSSVGSVVNQAVPVRKAKSGLDTFAEKRGAKQDYTSNKEAAGAQEAKRLRRIEAKKSEFQGVKSMRSSEFHSGMSPDELEAAANKLLGE